MRLPGSILFSTLVLVSILWSNATVAHDNPRVATVDIRQIERESIAWQKQIAIFEEQFQGNRGSMVKQEGALQEKLRQYEKQRPLLSQEQQETQDEEINRKLAELQNTAGQMNTELDQRSTRANQALRSKIAEIIQTIAEERTLDIILEAGEENFGIVYYSKRLDITPEVIQRLNDSYPAVIVQ